MSSQSSREDKGQNSDRSDGQNVELEEGEGEVSYSSCKGHPYPLLTVFAKNDVEKEKKEKEKNWRKLGSIRRTLLTQRQS